MYVSLRTVIETVALFLLLLLLLLLDFCNQTIYNLRNQDVTYYLWSETNGKKGANKICVYIL